MSSGERVGYTSKTGRIYIYIYICVCVCVCVATDYGLDGPGSNPGGDEIFRPSSPALGSTQPPAKWVPVPSRG